MDHHDFELPSDADKLSSRFILDSVKKRFLSYKPDTIEFAEETQEQQDEAEYEESVGQEEAAEEAAVEYQLCEKQEEASSHELAESSEPSFELSEDEISHCGTEAPAPTLDEMQPETPIEALNLPFDKKYFRVSEVSDLIGVEPYVLRYWQNEFSAVKPFKSSSGHWVYTRKDVETLHLIRHLLHVEKYSIKGAKKKLREKRSVAKALAPEQEQRQIEFLKSLAKELRELANL